MDETVELHQRLGQLIRSNHRYAFRAGEWADIAGISYVNGRACWHVSFPDGKTDDWVCDDPDGQYQFAIIEQP